MYFSQACQDKFILNVLKEKKNGFFLEIGSNHPININNTYSIIYFRNIDSIYNAENLPLILNCCNSSIDPSTPNSAKKYWNICSKLRFIILQISLKLIHTIFLGPFLITCIGGNLYFLIVEILGFFSFNNWNTLSNNTEYE